MAMKKAPLDRLVLNVLWACALLTLAGCGGPTLVPVSGKVTLDGKPLSHCGVSFHADTSKGNKGSLSSIGRLNAQGQYTLRTFGVKVSEGGTGAPVGWYKVTLRIGPGDPEPKVNPNYFDPNKTPLSLEVVADPAPDAYDLKLTSK
jgi:hypothetical protein